MLNCCAIARLQAFLFTSGSTMNLRDQKTTMLPKIEMGGWTTVKNNQTCMKQAIPDRSRKQNETFQQVTLSLSLREQMFIEL